MLRILAGTEALAWVTNNAMVSELGIKFEDPNSTANSYVTS